MVSPIDPEVVKKTTEKEKESITVLHGTEGPSSAEVQSAFQSSKSTHLAVIALTHCMVLFYTGLAIFVLAVTVILTTTCIVSLQTGH